MSSDTAMFGRAAASLGGVPHGCQVLILAEDFTAYSRAMQVARRIMDKMGNHADFDFRCWNFSELTDPMCAHTATQYAAMADMIMVSTQTPVLPRALNEWLDALRLARFRPVGVLGLILNKPGRQPEISSLLARLENLSMQLVMDFMPLLPPANEETAWQPQSLENWDMMPGRPEINQMRDVDHWGLNE
jgi:hypothetical protein